MDPLGDEFRTSEKYINDHRIQIENLLKSMLEEVTWIINHTDYNPESQRILDWCKNWADIRLGGTAKEHSEIIVRLGKFFKKYSYRRDDSYLYVDNLMKHANIMVNYSLKD